MTGRSRGRASSACCSADNACVVLEGAPSDHQLVQGWSYESFAPYLKRAAETLQTHVLADDELTPWHRAFRNAGGADIHRPPGNQNIVDGGGHWGCVRRPCPRPETG